MRTSAFCKEIQRLPFPFRHRPAICTVLMWRRASLEFSPPDDLQKRAALCTSSSSEPSARRPQSLVPQCNNRTERSGSPADGRSAAPPRRQQQHSPANSCHAHIHTHTNQRHSADGRAAHPGRSLAAAAQGITWLSVREHSCHFRCRHPVNSPARLVRSGVLLAGRGACHRGRSQPVITWG